MCKFNLKNRLKEIYSKFPEAEKAPVIGITTNHEGMDATLLTVGYIEEPRSE